MIRIICNLILLDLFIYLFRMNIILEQNKISSFCNTFFLLFSYPPSEDDKLGVFPLEKAPCLLYHCSQRFNVSCSFRGGLASSLSFRSIYIFPRRSHKDKDNYSSASLITIFQTNDTAYRNRHFVPRINVLKMSVLEIFFKFLMK